MENITETIAQSMEGREGAPRPGTAGAMGQSSGEGGKVLYRFGLELIAHGLQLGYKGDHCIGADVIEILRPGLHVLPEAGARGALDSGHRERGYKLAETLISGNGMRYPQICGKSHRGSLAFVTGLFALGGHGGVPTILTSSLSGRVT